MSRLDINTPDRAQLVVDQLYHDMERRIIASGPGLCPVDMSLNFLTMCHAQTCGKCSPCRIGLGQLATIMRDILDGKGKMQDLDTLEKTANIIVNTASCTIGTHAASLVLSGLKGFREDYEEHIKHHRCLGNMEQPVPCVALCPAKVDVPGYIALIREGRPADAVRLIRKDNPFPVACGYVCEHPCEARCRRNMLDDAINIRGLKRFACDTAGEVPQPACAPATGKQIAIVGGGPGGLSCAYYLALMGHKVTIFEKQKHLGGMLRYGIPSYRFPRELLEGEINSILSLGIDVHLETTVGQDVSFADLKRDYDCLYLAIGAHTDKKTGIDGEDSHGVYSAVEVLRQIGDDIYPDYRGKKVVIIGGGNVAMDVTRSAIRYGADSVTCVYRRRQQDMTALPEEVEGAIAEGAELLTMYAPVRIESDADGNVTALIAQKQLTGLIKNNRPSLMPDEVEETRIPADVIVEAIGQGIDSRAFEAAGVPVYHGTIQALSDSRLGDAHMDGVFAGGDCVTGPASAIRAIAAGKVAAANIDEHLGFNHEITVDVDIPEPRLDDQPPHARVNTTEQEANIRKHNFDCIECGMTEKGAMAESSRCLRCDHFGFGIFKGGRHTKW
ncbi:MAG: NAD(P)-binding protein [Peptococcaceae bacterium]|nr:NAD(P)-binding protein [Peptococcaceae bacterium]